MSGRRMHSYSRSQRRNLRYKLRLIIWYINCTRQMEMVHGTWTPT
jgi:hypothetical protein